MITMRSTTLNQNDEAVQVFTPKVVVQRRQEGARSS
jgi:acyl dehydratase